MCTNSNTQPSNGQQLSPDAFIENSQLLQMCKTIGKHI